MPSVMQMFTLSTVTIIFIVLLTGATPFNAVESPVYEDPPSGTIRIIANIILKIWNTVLFIFNAITFNVPDAPWYVRVFVTTIITAPIVWGIALLLRGGGGD